MNSKKQDLHIIWYQQPAQKLATQSEQAKANGKHNMDANESVSHQPSGTTILFDNIGHARNSRNPQKQIKSLITFAIFAGQPGLCSLTLGTRFTRLSIVKWTELRRATLRAQMDNCQSLPGLSEGHTLFTIEEP